MTLTGEVADATLAPHSGVLAGLDIWVPPMAVRGRRPGGVAALAFDRWMRGESDDPETLDAVYLHSAARPTT
jgi:hypothetical protein